MSRRYEWVSAMALPIELVGPGTELGGFSTDDNHALVLGDPYATALVVEGNRRELAAVAAEVVAIVQQAQESPSVDAADAARVLGRLRSNVETSSAMEAKDCDDVIERLDEVGGVLAGVGTGRHERVVWRLTAADLDAYAGRELTSDELDRIAAAVDNSTVPEAIGMIVDAVSR